MEEKKWSTVDGQQTTAIWNSTKVSCSQQILGNPGAAVDRGLLAVDKLTLPELSTNGFNKFEVNS
jgi:hypothetical protein